MNDKPSNPYGFSTKVDFGFPRLIMTPGIEAYVASIMPKTKIAIDFSKFFDVDFGEFIKRTAEVGRAIGDAAMPANLRGLQDVTSIDVFDFLGEFGIPLTPAPRGEIARSLIKAADHEARIAVLECTALDIAEDCEAVFDRLDGDPAVGDYVPFAKEAVAALRQDLPSAAQALFSAIATTVVDRMDFKQDASWMAARRSKVGAAARHDQGKVPNSLGDLPLYEYWAAAAIWHAYVSVDLEKGDELPEHWARHTSVHGLSDVHYRKAFAVVAMLFVATVLDFVSSSMEVEAVDGE